MFWNSYFKILAESHYQRNDDQFAKYCQTRRNHRFQELFCCWSLARHFAALTVKFFAEPHFGPKYGQFANHCHRPFIHRFPLVYFCILCTQHFGVLTVKFLLNQSTTHKLAILENIVTRLIIIVLCYSYSAYHHNDTLELLPKKCQLTPLWRKRYPICKIFVTRL